MATSASAKFFESSLSSFGCGRWTNTDQLPKAMWLSWDRRKPVRQPHETAANCVVAGREVIAASGRSLALKRRTSMNNYEVVDLFEVGNAGSTIMEKASFELDEIGEPQGVRSEGLDD